MRVNTWTHRLRARTGRGGATGVPGQIARMGYGVMRSAVDTVRSRRLITMRWVPAEGRWHYRWPEGRIADPGRWKDAEGWATYGFYYGMDDLLWRRYRPKQGDVVIDVGAGHGGESFFLAGMVGSRGRVVAVEAAPVPYERLVDMVRRNGWTHVTPVQAAVVAEPGEVKISHGGDEWIAGNIFDPGVGVAVRGRTIDELCESLGIEQVDWVKMNIEGAEKEALLGMERMAPHVSHLTISCHDFLGTEWGRSKDVVTAWLEEHGFTVEQRVDEDEVFALYLYAWR